MRDLASQVSCLFPDDPGFRAFCADSVASGSPHLVARPKNTEEVSTVLAYAHARRIPVTAAAGLTGLAGGATTEEGILLSVAGLKNSLEIAPAGGTATVTAAAGWVLGQLQRELAAEGWLYPPDPTSRYEALLGGTLATNATGEDTLLYGPTRRWVKSLEVVGADGQVHRLTRSAPPPREEKATAGYCLSGEPLDWFIGSEGTLGVITAAELLLAPLPAGVVSGLAFFPELDQALDFVTAARESSRLTPRALELIDGAALDLVRDNPEGIHWPQETGAAVVFRQETNGDRESSLEAWLDLVVGLAGGSGPWGRAVLVFDTARDQERLRGFRHRIPAVLQEKAQKLRDQKGAKVGSDWWVPYRKLKGMLKKWLPVLRATGMEVFVFGHAGNGHPHVNLMAGNQSQAAAARELTADMCRDAVGLGGGVAGEHGLGKLKRDLLGIQYPGGVDAMLDIKRRWDPYWLLGRGTIFPPEGM